jgi:hypothetical protein
VEARTPEILRILREWADFSSHAMAPDDEQSIADVRQCGRLAPLSVPCPQHVLARDARHDPRARLAHDVRELGIQDIKHGLDALSGRFFSFLCPGIATNARSVREFRYYERQPFAYIF